MKDHNYINVQGWMVNKLGLEGRELLCYATIFGFSQDGATLYSGSLTYLQNWLKCSRPTVTKVLDTLEKKGLIERVKVPGCTNGYRVISTTLNESKSESNDDLTSKNSLLPTSKENLLVDGGTSKDILLVTSKESLPHNIDHSNIDHISNNSISTLNKIKPLLNNNPEIQNFDDIKSEEQKQIKKSKSTEFSEKVIEYFNKKTGKDLTPSKSNLEFIRPRFNEGLKLEQAIKIMDLKFLEWWKNPQMKIYFQIPTLFNRKNVAKYLMQIDDPAYEQAVREKNNPIQVRTDEHKDHDSYREMYGQKQSFRK